MTSSTSRWPNSAKAAISFTMDNLGEAQDVNRNRWPHPIGTHPSIGTQLPRMLWLLEKHGIRATYFVESWSLGVYPSAIAATTANQHDENNDDNKSEKIKSENKGHEIAWHGYQHEAWTHLSPAEELDNFAKSFRAARESGITYEGFRPPGGEVNERTWALLREHGVRYVSPAAGEFGVVGVGREHEGVVVLPFEWRAVDAFYYMEKHGGGIVREPREFREYVMGRIDEVKRSGGFLSILAHPFLQTSEERFQVVEDILRRLAEDEEVWCAPCNQVASWMLEHRDQFESKMS